MRSHLSSFLQKNFPIVCLVRDDTSLFRKGYTFLTLTHLFPEKIKVLKLVDLSIYLPWLFPFRGSRHQEEYKENKTKG